MSKAEEAIKQNGTGYLARKNGDRQQVEWEIENHPGHGIGNGCVRGDQKHIAAAAEDHCAILEVTSQVTIAIAIDSHDGREASFTTLLKVSTSHIFDAQAIVHSGANSGGSCFSIGFSGVNGQTLTLNVPTTILRNYLPVLEKTIPPEQPASPPTSFVQSPNWCKTGYDKATASVVLRFDDEPPFSLPAESARRLADELVLLAAKATAKA